LRPSVLDDLGLAAAMRWFVDRFSRGGRIETRLSIGRLPALEPELETACFRVAQEALTNVDRHARATRVWIDLHLLDDALELSVRDDGIGFDVAAARARAISGESVGLLGMQERVMLMGGDYDVVRLPAGGTEVRARFPLAGPTT
jgi:signal transduction histidine kinase